MEAFIFCLQLLSFGFLVFHYANRKLPKAKSTRATQNAENITIVICAHNEAENLRKNLPKVLLQNNIAATVIVVNDRSTDETSQVLSSFAEQHSNLKIVEVTKAEKHLPGKKYLLYKALQIATTEKILVTDADCVPESPHWAASMIAFLKDEKRIVLGFSPFKKEATLLNKFIRFEATQAAWLYFSMAAKGNAYMGVGRNMAFLKSDYVSWYNSTQHFIAGGDDDLFVNTTASSKNVALCLSPDSFVLTEAKKNWKTFLMQKARHVQAAFHYKFSDQVFLMAFAIAQWLIIFLPILMLLISIIFRLSSHTQYLILNTQFSIILSFLWLTFQTVLSFKAYKKFGQNDLLKWIPLLQIIFVFYLIIVLLLSLHKGKKTWN